MTNNNFAPPIITGDNKSKFFRNGLAIFCITCAVYSGAAYMFLWVARELEIISLNLNWSKVSLVVWSWMILRLWDKAFFETSKKK